MHTILSSLHLYDENDICTLTGDNKNDIIVDVRGERLMNAIEFKNSALANS